MSYRRAQILHTLTVIVLSLSSWASFAQQQAQFTQYMFNTMSINPAYAGLDESLSLTFINRQQWSNIPNAPTTQTFTAHALSFKDHVGLGVSIVNDKIGVHQNQHALGVLAYHLQVGDQSTLSMGVQAGVNNMRSDYGSLIPGSGNDPLLASSIVSRSFFDMGFGLYFKSPKFSIGVSAPEILPKNLSVIDTLQVNLNSTNLLTFLKYRVPIGLNFDLEPSAMLKYLKGVALSYDANLNLIYKTVLTLGFSYRKQDSIAGLFRAQITPQFHAGYSYDYPVSNSSRLGSGSHEIMVNYRFKFSSSHISSPR